MRSIIASIAVALGACAMTPAYPPAPGQVPVADYDLTTFTGPTNEQIRVIGEAANPQMLAFRKKMTVLDVMIAVAELTDFADGNRPSIFRVSEAGKLYCVRLRDLVRNGDITANEKIRPGDILIIPQGYF